MKLKELHIKGFKSIDNHKGQTIPLGDVTVLLGANGSGKSNVVSFFKMFRDMLSEKLSEYMGRNGVESLLYYGSKTTENIHFKLDCGTDTEFFNYSAELTCGTTERLTAINEVLTYSEKDWDTHITVKLPFGGNESSFLNFEKKSLIEKKYQNIENVQAAESAITSTRTMLSSMQVFQFHDTSDTSHMKNRSYVDDASFLRSDARNLAAFLKMLKESEIYNKYYKRIVRYIQQVMPQFGDFSLKILPNNEDYTRLNWYEKNNSDYLFGPHQISDGSLRFMALATLFLQPPDLMPSFIVIDEPELGLHPSAIIALAGMIRMASKHAQVLVATQSTLLVDEFSLEDLVIVERDKENNCSIFKKLNAEKLKDWLADYSLSELWEKNVLGGKP